MEKIHTLIDLFESFFTKKYYYLFISKNKWFSTIFFIFC